MIISATFVYNNLHLLQIFCFIIKERYTDTSILIYCPKLVSNVISSKVDAALVIIGKEF